MSKKKRLLIACPTCGTHLAVKRSSFRVSNHPIYVKKGNLIINYNKSLFTDERKTKFWLRCLNPTCTFQKEFEDENALRSEIGLLAWDEIQRGKTHKPRPQLPKPKEEILPTIIKPPAITEEGRDDTSVTYVFDDCDSALAEREAALADTDHYD